MVIKLNIYFKKTQRGVFTQDMGSNKKTMTIWELIEKKMLSSDNLFTMYKVTRCSTLERILTCYRKEKKNTVAYILEVKFVIIKPTIKDLFSISTKYRWMPLINRTGATCREKKKQRRGRFQNLPALIKTGNKSSQMFRHDISCWTLTFAYCIYLKRCTYLWSAWNNQGHLPHPWI